MQPVTMLGETRPYRPRRLAPDSPCSIRSSKQVYVDDFYQWVINNIVLVFARAVAFFDRVVINDTGINGTGHVTGGLSFLLKFQQTGKLPNYALAMIHRSRRPRRCRDFR